MLERVLRSFRSNPIINRHLATTFTGPRLGLAFLLVTGCLLTTYAALFTEATYGYLEPGLTYLSHTGVLLGLLIVLLPIKVSGIIEGPRVNRAFDQVVATGAAPSTLYWGAWFSGLAYAALLLFVTLPFAVGIVTFGDAEVWTMCKGYATLLVYSNVIIAVTLACSVYGREWLSTPIAITALAGISLLSFIPDRDWVAGYPVVFAELSPVRLFIEQSVVDTPSFHPALSAPAPTFLFWKLPVDIVRPVLWAIVVAIGALLLTIGPGHVFAPGLDNFGAVVLRGDRKRGILGRLRGGITRRVEMAFFYENAPRWTARWGYLIRYSLAALPIVLTMVLLIGVVWGQSIVPSRWDFYQDWKGPVSIWVGGGVLTLWSLFSVTSRKNVLAVLPIGSRRVRTELFLTGWFVVLLACLCLVEYLPILKLQEYAQTAKSITPGKGVVTDAQVAAYVEAWWHHLTGMLILACNLFLIGRLASRMSNQYPVARILAIVGWLVLLAVPMLIFALIREGELPESLTPISYFSPAMLVPEFDRTAQVPGEGFGLFMTAHGILAGVLLVSLCLRYLRTRRMTGGGPSPALAILLGMCSIGALGAQEPRSNSPLRLKSVSRGFDGVTFSGDVDFYTVDVQNVSNASITARYWVETFNGSWGHGRCVISPGTTRTVRWNSVPRRGTRLRWRNMGDNKVVFQVGDHVMRSQPLDLLVLSAGQVRTPSSNRRQQTTEQHLFVGTRGSFPPQWTRLAMGGNTQNLVSCEPRHLPVAARDFDGVEVVWLTAEALAGLGREQQSALYHYLLMGGTVLFSGGLPAAELAGSGIFEELLRPEDEWTSQVGEYQLRHVKFTEGRDVSIALTAGGRPVPILHLRPVGTGHLGHAAFPPSTSKMPKIIKDSKTFWPEFDAGLPRGGFPAISMGLGDSGASGDQSMLWLFGGYYFVYALGLSAALFFFARQRRHRRRLWVLISGMPIVFLGFVPVLIASANSRQSLVEHTEVAIFHADSTHGLAARHMLVHSGGKQDHAVSMRGTSPAVYVGVGSDWRYRRWFSRRTQITRVIPLPVTMSGESSWKFDIDVAPWTSGEVFLFDSMTIPEPVSGTARRRQSQYDLDVRVPESLRQRTAFAVVQVGNGSFVKPLSIGADGVVRTTFKASIANQFRLQLHRVFVIPSRARLGGAMRTNGPARVFVAIAPDRSDESPPAISSDDMTHERDVSKRTAERSTGDSRRRRIRKQGSRYIEKLDHRVLLFEIPIAR